MSVISKLKDWNYKTHEIKLNKTHKDLEIPLNSPIVYITNVPITIKARINSRENDILNVTTVGIIKLPSDTLIESLFITTTSTSSDILEIVTSDVDIFSDVGIKDSVLLVDNVGVGYDARDVQQIDAELASAIALRDTALDAYSLDISAYRDSLFVVYSSLDQSLTVKYYGSVDGTKYHKLGSDITIADGSSTEQFDIQTISDSWKFMKVTVKAGTNPTAGSYTVEYSLKT